MQVQYGALGGKGMVKFPHAFSEQHCITMPGLGEEEMKFKLGSRSEDG